MASHVNSYYAATMAGPEPREPLRRQVRVDVCVVGAGFAGLSTALELARRGRSVAVLEARRVAWGASGRNGGFVAAGFSQGLDSLVARVGLDHARELYELSREGVRIVKRNIADLDLQAVEAGPGCLGVVRHEDAGGMQAARDRLERDFKHPVEYWPVEEVRAHLKSPVYFQGLYDAAAFHIHPLNYGLGLSEACELAGVELFENCPALALNDIGAGHRVVTPEGAVDAEHVVLCHSAYGCGLEPGLDRAVLPVATYVVATRADPELFDGAIATRAAVADSRRAGDYYRRLADGRLLWGGRITTRRSEPLELAGKLKQDIVAIYPQLAGLEIEYAWSGLMAYAVHKMPIIDRVRAGVWGASGFGGHGLNTTAVAGRLIASAIADGDDACRLFAPFGRPWAGGPLGRAATQAAYWYYQLRDRIEERHHDRPE